MSPSLSAEGVQPFLEQTVKSKAGVPAFKNKKFRVKFASFFCSGSTANAEMLVNEKNEASIFLFNDI
ncbi:hypothetical protein [Silvanigrella sp.]|uniref:hypothetical protein n=1 Tax=Silvanigrella sp. TaxID=2024976 RepID=UPI0037CB1B23